VGSGYGLAWLLRGYHNWLSKDQTFGKIYVFTL
jgi:hypothetical protein